MHLPSVWQALMDLSKSYICICALQMSGFAGLPVLHLSNPAVCICRQLISTLLLEQRWISHKTIFVFLKSNHLHFQTGDIHIWRSLFFFFTAHQSDRNSLIQPIFMQWRGSDGNIWVGWGANNNHLRKHNFLNQKSKWSNCCLTCVNCVKVDILLRWSFPKLSCRTWD